jgi:pimeloyl-ACP methyl ester carboxylesterase
MYRSTSVTKRNEAAHVSRIVSDFTSRGVRCSGWLYRPDHIPTPPVIIMAHGFAAEKDFMLPAFADRFAAAGLAVFLFDYRNFGGSGGEPRNYVHPFRHIQDWQAAVKHVRHMAGINPRKIALWGTSFSGGHVLVTASHDPDITAVVSQIPFVDGIASAMMDRPGDTLTATLAGIRDLLRVLTFRAPYCVPAVAKPGTFAAMNTAESWDGYLSLVPETSTWKNSVPARVFLTIPFYRPVTRVKHITCPVLMIGTAADSLIPVKAVRRAADKLTHCTYVEFDCGHFEPYRGKRFEENIALQIDFLQKQLMA